MMNSESPYLELLKRLNYNDEINFFIMVKSIGSAEVIMKFI